MSFHVLYWFRLMFVLEPGNQYVFRRVPLGPTFSRNRRFQGYTPEDVLPPGPQATSELDVLYHSVMHDKCVGGALPL